MMKHLLCLITCLSVFGQSEFGTIEIRTRLDAQTPNPPVITVDKNVDFCGKQLEDPILLTHEGLIINTVAYIQYQGEATPPQTPDSLKVSSKGCLLEPRIQSTHTGAFLHLRSNDTITHNPHGWLDDKRTVFNLTLVDSKMAFKRKLRWPGKYRIDCDTHSWMRAYVFAFDHPYHSVSDTNGLASIQNVPAGIHKITIWHEVLGEITAEVQVEAGKTTQWNPALALNDQRQDKLKPKTQSAWP